MPDPTAPAPELDVVVIGGGPAGLQAALTLGRMRRRVVLLDSGSYRNDPAHAMQNALGHDGAAPAALRADGRAEIARYATVAVREQAATAVEPAEGGFRVALADGGALRTRRVLLATGVADSLPAIPGVAELFGDRVIHCPYCHGHEIADGPIALLGAAAHVPLMASLIGRLATWVVVLADGAEVAPETAEALARLGAELRPGRVLGVRRLPARTAEGAEIAIDVEGEEAVEASGMIVHTAWKPVGTLADDLGLARAASGAIAVDALGRTSVPGVSAAGDAAQPEWAPMPPAAVVAAMASGLTAASTIDRELAAEEAGMVLPF